MTAPDTAHDPTERARVALAADVLAGLTATPKILPPKWFYDDLGSQLFDKITRLPEYYQTRAERSILAHCADTIAELVPIDTLVELGSGTSEKTRLLLAAFHRSGSMKRFVPFDVSEQTLLDAARAIEREYDGTAVQAIVGDFDHDLHLLPTDDRKLIAFLGGTIGNFAPPERARFLRNVVGAMRPGDAFLLGTDLVKDADRLIAAYDDSSGVTAAFNKNVLTVMNRELGANFALDDFDHRAVWDTNEAWIEMRLRARTEVSVKIPALDLVVEFERGEELRTEISAKFTQATVTTELARAGLTVTRWWTDQAGDFALSLATL